MLNVNPKLRPDCTKLLESQIIQSKMSKLMNQEQVSKITLFNSHSELLKTIMFPKNNWLSVRSKLPEPRYTNVKQTEDTNERHTILNSTNVQSTLPSSQQNLSNKRTIAESIKSKNTIIHDPSS
jgi:hypothetical protein